VVLAKDMGIKTQHALEDYFNAKGLYEDRDFELLCDALGYSKINMRSFSGSNNRTGALLADWKGNGLTTWHLKLALEKIRKLDVVESIPELKKVTCHTWNYYCKGPRISKLLKKNRCYTRYSSSGNIKGIDHCSHI